MQPIRRFRRGATIALASLLLVLAVLTAVPPPSAAIDGSPSFSGSATEICYYPSDHAHPLTRVPYGCILELDYNIVKTCGEGLCTYEYDITSRADGLTVRADLQGHTLTIILGNCVDCPRICPMELPSDTCTSHEIVTVECKDLAQGWTVGAGLVFDSAKAHVESPLGGQVGSNLLKASAVWLWEDVPC